MADTIQLGRNRTLLESLGQGFQLGLPGIVQSAQNRLLQQDLQKLAVFNQQSQSTPEQQQAQVAGRVSPEFAGQFGGPFPTAQQQFPQLQSPQGLAAGLQQQFQAQDPLRQAQIARLRALAKTPRKRTRSDAILEQRDKKIADGKLVPGSPEDLRLLGVRGDNIKTPQDNLKFWQTVLQKTKDAIGSDLPGQEQTSKLAQTKIDEVLKKFRKEENPDISFTINEAAKMQVITPEEATRIREGLKKDPNKTEQVSDFLRRRLKNAR